MKTKNKINVIKNILFDLAFFVKKIQKSNNMKEIHKNLEIKKSDFSNIEIFLVGGFIRDLFLKKLSMDLDFAVNKNTEKISFLFAKYIKATFICLDAENNSYRIVKRLDNGETIQLDFTEFRGKNIKYDIKKRDFTVNSFAIELEKFLNILNKNKEKKFEKQFYSLDYQDFLFSKEAIFDIKHKIIRMNNKNVFFEDPIRLFRSIRIFDKKNLIIEDATKKQISKDAKLINLSAKERVHDEIIKIFSKKYFFPSLLFLNDTGILDNVFGDIFFKNEKKDYYHKEGLFGHLLETLFSFEFLIKNLEKIFNHKDDLDKKIIKIFKKYLKNNLPLFRLACLFHDIGKPDCKSFVNNKIHFLHHEEIGENKAISIFKNLKFSNKEINFLSKAILFHMQASNLSKFQDIKDRAIYRFFKRVEDEKISIFLLIFSAADILASIRGKNGLKYSETEEIKIDDVFFYEDFCRYINFVRKVLNWFLFTFKEKKQKKFLDGNEIMNILNIPSGKKVGEILKFLDEQTALKEINNKKEAIEKIKLFFGKN